MSDMTLEKAKEILKPFEACKQFPIFWMEKNIDGSWSTAALLEAHSFLEGYRAGLKKAAESVRKWQEEVGFQTGCDGTHRGIGNADCQKYSHHHHDARCIGPEERIEKLAEEAK